MKIPCRLRPAAILFPVLFFTLPLTADEPWATAKSEDGITVLTRKGTGSPLKEFHGRITIKASLSALVAVLSDAPSYPTWQFECQSASLLTKTDFHNRTTYVINRAPWPVSNRDMVVRSILTQDKSSKTVTVWLQGLPNAIPPKQGLVRVAALQGFWQLQPAGNGNVNVIYQMLVDPGGSLPAGLANTGAVMIPFNTLQKLRLKAGEDPYKGTHFPEIEEPKE